MRESKIHIYSDSDSARWKNLRKPVFQYPWQQYLGCHPVTSHPNNPCEGQRSGSVTLAEEEGKTEVDLGGLPAEGPIVMRWRMNQISTRRQMSRTDEQSWYHSIGRLKHNISM